VNLERLIELAAEFAQGAATEEEQRELINLLAGADASARAQVANLMDTAALLSLHSLSSEPQPPAELKNKILGNLQKSTEKAKTKTPPLPGFKFEKFDEPGGWVSLPIKGAYVKMLSMDQERGYAVALGKLDPGARYPAHSHTGPEEVFVLSGDLHIGPTRLGAGDFHHADAGSQHDVNFSETGCVIMVVLTLKDLQAQFASA
jgi:quercetin dioxygenase-like cupin family protein